MDAAHRVARATLESGRQTFLDNVTGISLEEALDAGGGFRSIHGLAKHTAAWTAVYHSFAFDEAPRSWAATDWPRGLRERIEPSEGYIQEVLAWFERSSERWLRSVEQPTDLDEARPVHGGDVWPLRQIVAYTATHWAYHAGEINVIIANRRRPPDPTVSTHRFRQTRALSAYTRRPATQNPRAQPRPRG